MTHPVITHSAMTLMTRHVDEFLRKDVAVRGQHCHEVVALLHFRGVAVGKTTINETDADALLGVEAPTTRCAAELHLPMPLRAMPHRHGLEDTDRPLQCVCEREDLWPATPYARLAHCIAICLRRHAVLVSSLTHQLSSCDRLPALQVQLPPGIISERVDCHLAEIHHTLCQ